MVRSGALEGGVWGLEELRKSLDGGMGTLALGRSEQKLAGEPEKLTSTISIINGLTSGRDSLCTRTSSSIVLQTT